MSAHDDEFPISNKRRKQSGSSFWRSTAQIATATCPSTSSFGPAGTILANTVLATALATGAITSSGVLEVEAVATSDAMEPELLKMTIATNTGDFDDGRIQPDLSFVTIRLDAKQSQHLKALVDSGLYGSTADEAILTLMLNGFREAWQLGVIGPGH